MDKNRLSEIFSRNRGKRRDSGTAAKEPAPGTVCDKFQMFKPSCESLTQMNLRGRVRSMTRQTTFSDKGIFSGDKCQYGFDSQGRIKNIRYSSEDSSDFTYDEAGRILNIKSGKQETHFIYGTHEKYIDVDWCDELPRFLQGIETLIDKNGEDSLVYTWNIDGDRGRTTETVNGILCETGEISFEGLFPRTAVSRNGTTRIYSFNPVNGILLKWEEHSAGNLIRQQYRDNFFNNLHKQTFKSQNDPASDYIRSYTENGSGEITGCTDNEESLYFEYEYDFRGNWIKQTCKKSSGKIQETIERLFTYY